MAYIIYITLIQMCYDLPVGLLELLGLMAGLNKNHQLCREKKTSSLAPKSMST